MKVLVTGSKGMLGTDLTEILGYRHAVIGVDIDEMDITDRQAVVERIGFWMPDVVIHTAAFTDVDGSERKPDLAHKVNADGAENVALACRAWGAHLIHLSTDYVFDGRKETPYAESDLPNPLGVYGKSKLEGEQRARRACPEACIVRTAWMYGRAGRNFVQAILAQARPGAVIRVVNDQRGSPTYTRDLARALLVLAEKRLAGIYHVTNAGSCTWYEFAEKILEFSGKSNVRVAPVSTAEFGRPAPRPANSVLDGSKFQRDTGMGMRDWKEALKAYLLAPPAGKEPTP